MKRLIVNADDFGMTHGVNKGIIAASRKGIVTAASIMVTGQAFEEAVALARENPKLDIGLHLSLTVGRPASNDPAVHKYLASHGTFRLGNKDLLMGLMLRTLSPSASHREIEAQFEKAVRTRLPITHVDGHESIHLFPGIRERIFELMERYSIPFIRLSYERIGYKNVWKLSRWKKSLINLFGLANQGQISRRGIRTTDHYHGTFDAGYLGKERLMATIRDLKEGTSEIMCHPGYRDESFDRISGGRYLPDQELGALMDPEVKRLLRDRGVRLISFKDL
jgi:hopanoid biosynthesis associated protein HpnK